MRLHIMSYEQLPNRYTKLEMSLYLELRRVGEKTCHQAQTLNLLAWNAMNMVQSTILSDIC